MEKLELSLLVFQIIIAVVMIIAVLLQKTDSDSLSGIGGSGGLNSVVSTKSSVTFLSRVTMFLIGLFMLNCLILASIHSKKNKTNDQLQIDKILKKEETNNQISNQKNNQESGLKKEDSQKNNSPKNNPLSVPAAN